MGTFEYDGDLPPGIAEAIAKQQRRITFPNGNGGGKFWDRWGSLVLWFAGTVSALFLMWSSLSAEVAVLKSQMTEVQKSIDKLGTSVDSIRDRTLPGGR